MKRQDFDIKNYGWHVTVFYDTGPEDFDEIGEALFLAGCSDNGIRRSERNILSRGVNKGLTFSNRLRRLSIMSLGEADSLPQFLNTWQHEITHLNRHMCEAFRIDPFSEEAAYLSGDIAQLMYPVLSHYICGCSVC